LTNEFREWKQNLVLIFQALVVSTVLTEWTGGNIRTMYWYEERSYDTNFRKSVIFRSLFV